MRPSLVVADPALMASAPMPLLAATALNALAHAVEALYTPLANPVASMAALRGAELIAAGLPDDREPEREALALGALLAGYASGQTGYAVHHVVCQTIVRVGGTPHAETNATMLPHTVRLMRGRAPEEIALVEQAIGDPDRLAARAGVSGLRALGFDEARVGDVVAAVLPRPELPEHAEPAGRGRAARIRGGRAVRRAGSLVPRWLALAGAGLRRERQAVRQGPDRDDAHHLLQGVRQRRQRRRLQRARQGHEG